MTDVSPPFHIQIGRQARHVVLRPVGELDLATAPEVRERVDELRSSGVKHVIVDLGEVTFCDSTGLRILAELDAESRANGFVMELIPATGAVQRLFELTGMTGVFRYAQPAGA